MLGRADRFAYPSREPDKAFLQRAAEQDRSVRAGIVLAVLLYLAWLAAAGIARFLQLQPLWQAIFLIDAAAVATYAAGLVAARAPLSARMEQAGLTPLPLPAYLSTPRHLFLRIWNGTPEPGEAEEPPGALARLAAHVGYRLTRPPLPLLAVAGVAILTLAGGWRFGQPAALPPGGVALLFAGLHAALAYAYLVEERRHAGEPASVWPEAAALSRLARLPVLALTLNAGLLLLADRELGWTAAILPIAALLIGIIAAEILLRAVLSLFQPAPGDGEARFAAQSSLAGLLDWPPRPVSLLQKELLDGFGIDLRQIWAFAFIRSALPRVALLMAALAWLCSGLITVPLSARGIYEQFGRPISVLQPGLHVGLPWPMSRVIPVENGAVHELATVSATNGAPDEGPADAEGPAPDTANRLWDGTHVSEKSQIIANGTGNGLSVEIVDMDVRFVYRIGLDDAAAMDAAYRIGDLDRLIENVANRALMHDFAARTLDTVLVSGRQDMAARLQTTVQADLDRLHSGVELLAVVIEAIHPPAGASAAYHSVQAAQIAAEGLIARERGAAGKQLSEAHMQATVRQDEATGAARATLSAASVTDRTFRAERDAFAQAGQAFLSETYLANLAAGLSRARLLILDHRLSAGAAPLLDFRTPGLPALPDAGALAPPPDATEKKP